MKLTSSFDCRYTPHFHFPIKFVQEGKGKERSVQGVVGNDHCRSISINLPLNWLVNIGLSIGSPPSLHHRFKGGQIGADR